MTPILRWLMQLNIWRFVGFASTVIGLLCFALSSSFNHLFGEWNLLKKFLYCVFSFIICLMILYANTWQHSRSLRFKAHTAFLVLTITSVYSFFFDKVVKGKPDAYSLISCAALALMSLSLSKQTQCGFEVDLMYFYLGCLIVQLMKIKLPLAIVGASYSYFLIILRSSFSSIDATPENEYLEDQEVVIQVDSQQLTNTNCGSSIKQQFLTCIKELQQNNSNLTNMLLKRVKNDSVSVVADHNFIIDALPPEIINDLHETAKLMVNAGLEKECSDIYISCRRELLEDLLMKKILGLGKIGFQDYMIGRWIKASKVAIKILFPGERRLYDRVFSGFSSISDLCFLEACHGATIQLLNFSDSFANGMPSAWRFFKILDLFKTLCELIPEFQLMFPDSLVSEAIKVKNRLGEVSRDIFTEFGNVIFHTPDAELDVWADGGVHSMTHEAKSYLVFAFFSRQILEQILKEYPMAADGVGTPSSFYAQMIRIMEQLERKLEEKSKIYEDPALRYFFMMNNLSYIASELRKMGDDRFCKNTQKHFELYYRSSWSKVLEFLRMNSSESEMPNVAAEAMNDMLNLFNLHFTEMCRIQSTWSAFDKQLREEIITSLENILLPAYGNFIAWFQDVLGKHAHEHIEYGISDIKDRLSHLFDKRYVHAPICTTTLLTNDPLSALLENHLENQT